MATAIRVEPSSNRHTAEYVARQYAPGVLLFEEITIPRADVQVGDQTERYGKWQRVTQVFTDKTGDTRIYVGASDWKSRPAVDMITVRRYIGPAPVEAPMFNVFVDHLGVSVCTPVRDNAYEASAVVNVFIDAGYDVCSDLHGEYVPDAMVTPTMLADHKARILPLPWAP